MSKINISDAFSVYRFGNGVKLLRPGHIEKMQLHDNNLTLDSLLQLPFPVYLENTAHISIKSNEATAKACGFLSLKDFLGKPPFRYFKKDTIIEKLANHKNVIENNKLVIAEEHALRTDGSELNTLSVRMPWYNDDNKVVGLFGCSIVLGENSLADSLQCITQLGLLNCLEESRDVCQGVGVEMNSVYLSKRELDCLRLTIKGRPAKQVAYDLKLSQRTVEEYLDNIKRKMKVSSKAALIEKGIEYIFKGKI